MKRIKMIGIKRRLNLVRDSGGRSVLGIPGPVKSTMIKIYR